MDQAAPGQPEKPKSEESAVRGHTFFAGPAARLILISLTLVSLLTACGGQELSDVTLIQTLGVDGKTPVKLTAVGEDESDAACYRAWGGDLVQARERLKKLGRTRLEVTHVAQLVLGPDVPVEEVLRQELANRESGYGATVWLTRSEPAGELLAQAADPCKRLKAMEKNGSVEAPTLLEALSTLTREGQVTLPVLAREGEELTAAGTWTVKEE